MLKKTNFSSSQKKKTSGHSAVPPSALAPDFFSARSLLSLPYSLSLALHFVPRSLAPAHYVIARFTHLAFLAPPVPVLAASTSTSAFIQLVLLLYQLVLYSSPLLLVLTLYFSLFLHLLRF